MKSGHYTARTSAQVTYGVWKALFLREAVTRIAESRTAWIGLILEPVLHIAFLMLLFIFVRVRVIGGIETATWVMVGLIAFFMFRRTAIQAKNAVNANQALFAYRQVKPVDAVLVRAGLEGFLTVVIAIIVFSGAALFGIAIVPADPLAVLEAIGALWLLGVGFGLVASVANELLPAADNVIRIAMVPLYMLSGVMIPVASVPQPYRDWLLLNPIVHGLEATRLGFAPYYHSVGGLNMAYLYECALVLLFLGFALHRRFAARLLTR